MSLKDKIEDILPLTPLQKGLLFHSLYNPESSVYFEQLNCRLEGNVSIDAVNQAWQTLINRHTILRTAIVTKGQTEPVQVVFRNINFKVIEEDWRGFSTSAHQNRLQQFLEEDRRQGFVLNRPPLMRVTLIRLTEASWQLVWSHHHLLLDGWSMPLLMREFFILHKAANEGVEISLPQVRPYSDFIAWLKRKNPQAGEAFWREYMRGIASPTPLLMMSAQNQDAKAESIEIRLQINQQDTARLSQLARNCSVTLNTIIQGAWAILLNRYSRSSDILYGITVSGRPPEIPGVEQMIGPFINTLPLRVTVSAESQLDAWLQMLQRQQVEVRQFEHTSLLDIQSWSDIPRGKTLFESLLAFENFPVDKSLKAEYFGLNITDVSFLETTNYPLTLVVIPGDELLFKLTYNARFDHVGMELMLKHLHNLLINMANNAKASLSDLSLLPANDVEKQVLNSENKETLASRFRQIVNLYPNQIAVSLGKESLTYAELNQRANKLAQFLMIQGIGAEKRVVICLERSVELIVAMLAVVKAGGVYVPVDPASPPSRIEFTVTDCEAQLVLTTTSLASLFPASTPVVCLDGEDVSQTTELPENYLQPDDGAYVIYTSGSTGKPKGVLLTQNNVIRLFQSTDHWYKFNQTDVWTFFHSFAFDFSVWEIWGALLHGGRLVIVPYAVSRDPQSFLQLIRAEKVTVLNQTPSAFTQLLAAEKTLTPLKPNTLRYIIFGGEALNLLSLRPWFELHGTEKTRLVNMYGITETTVHVTYRAITLKDLENTSSSLIGEPIPDLSLSLMDDYGNRLPPGVIGEIHVGGAGVARGYLNRPEQNAQRFVRDPQDTTKRLYRSGDLGRLLPNGDLEYLGRIDHQVKIRGFRIEIGEIEAAISRFPSIQENIVIVHGDDNEKQLIAYIVCTTQEKPSILSLRNHLHKHIPEYMVPSHFVYLDKFPLTTNGKIDRQALPSPEIKRENLGISFVPPETEAEKILATIWQKVLGVDVGRFDNYFALGGDSIRSIRVCSLAEEAGLNLKLEQIFTHPVLADLATFAAAKQIFTHQEQPFAQISAADQEKLPPTVIDAYPLAQLQAGMLFYSDYSEGATTYNDLFSFRIRIPFNLEVWQQAYAQMFSRHRILRTAFYLGEFSQPLQVVLQEVPNQIQFADLTALPQSEQENYLESLIEKERKQGFDPSQAPLIRFHLHRLDGDILQATFAVHHAILDGWSLANFIAELSNLYIHLLDGSVPAPPTPPNLEYSKFVALEQASLADANQRHFWQRQIENIPFTKIPRLPGVDKNVVGMGKIDITLPQQVSQGLKTLSQKLGVPLKTVLLAVHMRLLAFYSGEEEIVTGLVSNGRPQENDGDRTLGLFLNTLPFRLKLSHGSWIDLIEQTFQAEQTLISYRRFPFAEIQRLHGQQLLYETSFNFVHFHIYKQLLDLRNVELLAARSFDETNIPFSVSWSEEVATSNLLFNITYNNEFTEAQAAAIANSCQQICAAIVTNPEANSTQVEVTKITDIYQPQHDWVHEIFEKQVATSPHSIAVTCDDTWTSSELNNRANQIARFLRKLGITTDQPVGICLQRSNDMVSAILAVLKAGGCYVPIDPNYPAARIQAMVEETQTSIILTDSRLGINLGSAAELVFLDTQEFAQESTENLQIPVFGTQAAYIIFTSGSTGRPKAITISHEAIANHMAWFLDVFAINSQDAILQKTPFSFDASVWEFWAALMTGAKLVMAKPGGHQDSAYLIETIKKENITLLQVVPTLLEVLLAESEFAECSSLRTVFAGGEALKQRVWQQFQNMAIPLVNLYGPAETTIDVTFNYCHPDENIDTVLLGESVANTNLYILDSNFQPVPVGTPGEIFITGSQLARGYQTAAITAEKFLPDPFSANPGSRMYRTGDRGRFLPQGIEFLGRVDNQLKIRGFRIETSEVVAAIENQPWIVRAVAKAFDTRLVAYVELKQPPENWQQILRKELRHLLPEYMIPALFINVDTWTLLPNGKIDLNALPQPDEENTVVKKDYVAPRNNVEKTLTKIWQQVLRIANVGIEDNFFELGGDSILCLQIIAKTRAAGLHFTPQDLFNHPSISELAVYVKQSGKVSLQKAIKGEIPLTPIQQWFFDQALPHPEHWNQAILLDLRDLPIEVVQARLAKIAKTHDVFRLRFRQKENQWVQYLVDEADFAFDVVDTSTNSVEIKNEFQAKLDLENGPLARAVYFHHQDRNQLLLIMHHLIVDGVSWRVILQQLAGEESGFSSGFANWASELSNLSELPWQQDLSFWQMQQVSHPELPVDFPGCETENKESSATQIECNFSKAETESLLYELPRTRQARIQEVLLTVLLEAVTDWTKQSEMVVAMESHGREVNFTDVDIFNSVGWFTSLFPLRLEATNDLWENLANVKENLRNLPQNGFSYGILNRKTELPKIPTGILFNYLGQFDDNPETTPFLPALEDAGISRHPQGMRAFQLEITGLIVDGKLQMRFVYSKALHHQETIRGLADSFYNHFITLLQASRTQEYTSTPTDFPLAGLNVEQLNLVTENADVEDIYPLAPVQEGMIFHANYESQSGVYLQQVTGEIEGVLDSVMFEQAWLECIQRHPSLRASFVLQPKLLQVIHRQVNLPFVYEDWCSLNTQEVIIKWEKLLEIDRQQGFSLQSVLMRLTLVKIEEHKYRFLWTHHHILLDGWSLPLIFRDVMAIYQGEKLPQPPMYRDFISWLGKKYSAEAESFWRQELAGLEEATSFGFKSQNSYCQITKTLSNATVTKLKAFAQDASVTLNTLVQAAWSILLSRYSGSDDVVYGVTVSGRPPELPGSAEMVGLFINTLPLRVTLDEAMPMKQWLQKLRDRLSQINEYSFSRLVDIQGISDIPRGQPLFASIVVYENYPVGEIHQDHGVVINSVESLEQTHYPVTLYALPGEDLQLKLAFAENIGSDAQRQQLISQLTHILESFAQVEFVGDIHLTSQVGEVDFRSYPDTVCELFSKQASLTPNALAVCGGNSLTYAELESQSNQVAHALRQLGVEKETLVGVYLERHAGLVVVLLGILKAGAAYVPLDPSFPGDRLNYMLADSGATVIVTEETIANQIPPSSAKLLLLEEISQQSNAALPAISGKHLAYVIYTSGSTGKPKGVQIQHDALTNFLLSFQEKTRISADDTLVAVTTVSFDISILELFLPLIAGARLVIANREAAHDGFILGKLLNENQATVMQATPTTWRLLLNAGWKPNQKFRALCGGEAMPIDLAASVLNLGLELTNVYGPTETTIWSTVNLLRQAEDAVSIGRPISNTSTYILDRAGHPVPEGVVGELFIGGIGVARGYRGRPDLTADKFLPNPFGQPGERLYRTGDLARFLPNGEIEFLGRIDHQVKIRGFRIELGDIEYVLEKHDSIDQVIVQPFEDTGNKILVAYIVSKSKLNSEILRSYVREKLPEYMIPSAWVFLEAMPLTPNNKVDRRALPAPTQLTTQRNYTPPTNVIEEALVEIWRDVMKVEKIGVKDNFFDLGGHSLVAAQIHACIRKVFSIDVSLRELFNSLTIEKIAQVLLAQETQAKRTEKIAQAFLRMKRMTPEEKAKLLKGKGVGSGQ